MQSQNPVQTSVNLAALLPKSFQSSRLLEKGDRSKTLGRLLLDRLLTLRFAALLAYVE